MAVSNTQVIFDNLYGIFTYLAIIVGVIVFALMAYLIIRYRAKNSSSDPEDTPRLGRIPTSRGHGRNVLITVTLSTFLLVILIITSRSEEHTSELQSRENLVCRLLLEKKKNKK